MSIDSPSLYSLPGKSCGLSVLKTIMREIKFRAWDGMEMRYQSETIHFFFPYKGSGKVMQYTGLKDKNGKEIYEGDIVEIDTEGATMENWNEVVEYREHFISPFHRVKEYPVEVIGNIYENPELL